MRHVGPLFLAVGLLLIWTGVAPPASLKVQGGDVTLSISSATAGQDPDPVVDQITSNLRYSKGIADPTLKITVATDLGSPVLVLKVEAINVGDGSATGEIVLGTTAQDLVTGVTAESFAYCDLKYSSVALASDGVVTDAHTVTYTMVAQ